VCGQLESKCFEVGSSYVPVIVGATKSFINATSSKEAVKACQKYCAGLPDCAHFVMAFPHRTCDVAAKSAVSSWPAWGHVSGPPTCAGTVVHGDTSLASLNTTGVSCFEDDIAYEPLDMDGHVMTWMPNATACQQSCAVAEGCAHFSYLKTLGHCHLADSAALRLQGNPGFVSGPALCGQDAHKCFEVGSSYVPVIVGASTSFISIRDKKKAAKACQDYCNGFKHCAHFVIRFPDQTCDLATESAAALWPTLFHVAGPSSCPGHGSAHADMERKFLSSAEGEFTYSLVPIAVSAAVFVSALCFFGVVCRFFSRGIGAGVGREVCVEHRYELLHTTRVDSDDEDPFPIERDWTF